MTIEDLQQLCSTLKGTTQDIKWEDHLCFSVGKKLYLITSPELVPPTASFKTSENDFALLTEREGIFPARYLARYKWVQVDDINRLSLSEWKKYLKQSYEMVIDKLPAKTRKEILK